MPAKPGSTQIGFVGLGIMGAPMALNLIKAGFSLKVYNRTDRPRVQEVVDVGGNRVATPAAAANGSDVIITMVTDTPDAEKVILGEDGVLQTARAGATVTDMSTISPRATRDIAAALREKGVHMLDAPVSGGDVGAQQGTLSIMVGGEQSVFDDCLPVFEAMGKNINLIGGKRCRPDDEGLQSDRGGGSEPGHGRGPDAGRGLRSGRGQGGGCHQRRRRGLVAVDESGAPHSEGGLRPRFHGAPAAEGSQDRPGGRERRQAGAARCQPGPTSSSTSSNGSAVPTKARRP